MYCLILLAFVASVSANVYHNAQCPLIKPVQNFNLEAYGNGVWYEIAKYPNEAEKGGQCGSTEYKLYGNKFKVRSFHIANGKLLTIKGSARLAPASAHEGKLLFSLPYGDGGAFNEYTAWVLDTDYENYAIVYYCKYNPAKKTRQDYAWILSRTKTLDAESKEKIERFIEDSKFLDSSKFIYTDFSEDACSVNY